MLVEMFPISNLSPDTARILEQMGTKYKFWYLPPGADTYWLFKQGRPNTGENWAEKVAAELCVCYWVFPLPHMS